MNKNILSEMLINLFGKFTKNKTDSIHIDDCEMYNNKTRILH